MDKQAKCAFGFAGADYINEKTRKTLGPTGFLNAFS